MDKTYTLELSSSLDELARVQETAEQIVSECNLDEELGASFSLVLSEACTNAILHGNKLDESKTASVSIVNTSKEITITVEDQGPGFDPENVPNPLAEENLLKQGGRGVYLIKEYADVVTYNDKGNKVTIIFHKSS